MIFQYLPLQDVIKFGQVSKDNRLYADSFLSKTVPTTARQLLGDLYSIEGTHTTYKKSAEAGRKIWELCKTDPSKFEKNLPFFKYWLEKKKILVEFDQEDRKHIRYFLLCQTSSRLSNVALRFIVSHMMPELPMVVCDEVCVDETEDFEAYSFPEEDPMYDKKTLQQMIDASIDLTGKDYQQAIAKGYRFLNYVQDTPLHHAVRSSKSVYHIVKKALQAQNKWQHVVNQPNALESDYLNQTIMARPP